MEKKLTAELQAALAKKVEDLKKGTQELSLDDLASVNGGYSVTQNENSVNISFTEEEYQQLKVYLEDPLAKSMIAQLGFGDIQLERNMTLPLEEGQTIASLLSIFYKQS